MGVVITVPEASMDYILYGNQRQQITDYLANQLSQLPSHFTDFGNRIINNVKQTYNYLTDELLQRTIINRASDSRVYVDDNGIYAYESFKEMQNANISMQRWVMAHPGIRESYLEQNCDGYSNSYVNTFGKNVGVNHYDYRRVMGGIPIEDDGFTLRYFHEDLQIGDRELEYNEKISISKAWSCIDWIMENSKFDFTNPTGTVKRGE